LAALPTPNDYTLIWTKFLLKLPILLSIV
jgi:hypothetical protein